MDQALELAERENVHQVILHQMRVQKISRVKQRASQDSEEPLAIQRIFVLLQKKL